MTKMIFRKGTLPADEAAVLRFAEELESDRTPLACNYSSYGGRKVGETSDGLVLQFIAVSEGIKRDGSTIDVKGIDLAGIQSNPVFMFGHNYSEPPIGRIIGFRKSTVPGLGKVLKVDVAQLRSTVDTEHKRFSDSIFDMYVHGDLRTVSFGWRTVEADPIKDDNGYHTGWNFKRTDAMEVSAVPVPADKDALITNIQQRGLDPARFVMQRNEKGRVYEVRESIPEGFEFLPEQETEVEDIVLRAADPIRKEETTPSAPESNVVTYLEQVVGALVTVSERLVSLESRLTSLESDEANAAFVQSLSEAVAEISEQRIGASLNAANRKALTDAVTLIAAVLKNAGPVAADAGAQAATPPAEAPEVITREDDSPTVSFEGIGDIRKAMLDRRNLSAAENILTAMQLRKTGKLANG